MLVVLVSGTESSQCRLIKYHFGPNIKLETEKDANEL